MGLFDLFGYGGATAGLLGPNADQYDEFDGHRLANGGAPQQPQPQQQPPRLDPMSLSGPQHAQINIPSFTPPNAAQQQLQQQQGFNFGGSAQPPALLQPQQLAPALAPVLARPKSIWDRIKTGLSGGNPQGYDQLGPLSLTPQEIQHARPGWIHGLIGAPDALSPAHQYQQNLNELVQMKLQGQQLQTSQRMQAQEDEANQRYQQAMAQATTPEQQLAAMRRRYADALGNGSPLVAQANAIAPALFGNQQNQFHAPVEVSGVTVPGTTGAQRVLVDPRDPTKVLAHYPMVAPPKDPGSDLGERRLQLSETRAHNAAINTITTAFKSEPDVKDFNELRSAYTNILNAQRNPSKYATSLLLKDAIARFANPGAVVRAEFAKMVDHLGNLEQRADAFWTRNATGGLPQKLIDEIQQQTQQIIEEHWKHYSEARDRFIDRGDMEEVDLRKQFPEYKEFAPNDKRPNGKPYRPNNPMR